MKTPEGGPPAGFSEYRQHARPYSRGNRAGIACPVEGIFVYALRRQRMVAVRTKRWVTRAGRAMPEPSLGPRGRPTRGAWPTAKRQAPPHSADKAAARVHPTLPPIL